MYHHSDDLIAVRCGSLEVSLQGARGFSAWTGIIEVSEIELKGILRYMRMVYTSPGILESVPEGFRKDSWEFVYTSAN